MAKDKRRIDRNRARKKDREKKRKQRAAGGGRYAHTGCTRGEMERSPVHAAYVGTDVLARGIGYALIARRLPDGRIAAGVFLIDAYCLGVKDAFFMLQSPSEFEDIVRTRFGHANLEPVEPAYARKLIEGAMAYARDLGFEPHRDYRDASLVLGDIDPAACDVTFVFGKDGKPFYISGPYDSYAKIRRVLAQLRHRCGEDGARFLVREDGLFADDAAEPDDDQYEEEEDDEYEDEDGEEIKR